MHKPQAQVEEFHRVMDQPHGGTPCFRDVELRLRLMKEELKEIDEAAEAGDLVAAIDGVCDLLYVTYGTAVAWGFDVEPFFDEVQRANMAKADGPVREDGKRLKPPGWKPPDIERILREQRIEALEQGR